MTTSTTGAELDPDGYTITIDGGEHGAVSVGASVTLEGLTPGDHLVGLSGVAANCQIEGQNPRPVTVSAGASATATFAVTCAAPPPSVGTLRITTSSTGDAPDQDGYVVTVNDGTGQPIGQNATADLHNIPAGTHSVRLSGVAQSCAVAGTNPRAVSVAAGTTAEVSFAITCSTSTGGVRVSVTTTGDSPDADGYQVLVDGGTGQPVASTGEITIENLAPGSHSFQLEGIATHCSVEGTNPVSVVVNAASTAELSFAVVCTRPSGNAYQRTDLDFLPLAINNQGHIAGTRGQNVVLWRNGEVTDLGTFGGTAAAVTGLNNHDVVVGYYTTSTNQWHGFLWDGTGHDLGPDFIPWGGINDSGEMAGFTRDGSAAFRSGDAVVPMNCFPSSINNLGEVSGVHEFGTPSGGIGHNACLWDGVLRDLGVDVDKGTATDVSDSHVVVGIIDNSFTYEGFVWSDGTVTKLPSLGGSAAPSAISNSGVIVGASDEEFNSLEDLSHPVVWKSGTISRLAEEFGGARDVNDSGQIVGIITKDRTEGSARGVLWTPSAAGR